MALLWNCMYETGQVKIDAEHHEWFRLANDFLIACNKQSRNESAKAFALYTRQHFFNEETLMRAIQYPCIATHVGDHDRLFSTLNKLFYVDAEGMLSKTAIEEFVGFTLAKHITAHDAQVSVYIKRSQQDSVI